MENQQNPTNKNDCKLLSSTIIMLAILCVMISPCVSAWSSVTFNNSLGEENLTFTGNQNITRWLSIPVGYSDIKNAYLNLSGYLGGEQTCEVSTVGASGIYPENVTWYAQTFMVGYSGENITYEITNVGISDPIRTYGASTLYAGIKAVNSSNAPTGVDLSNGTLVDSEVQEFGTWTNISMSAYNLQPGTTYALVLKCPECYLDLGVLYNPVFQDGGDTYGGGALFNSTDFGSTWAEQTGDDLTFIVRGKIYPQNVSLNLENDNIFNYTNTFSQQNNKTINFNDVVNKYLNITYLVGSNYLLPFIFHSDSIGVLQYLDLIFNTEGFTENSQTYTTPILEGKSSDFSINITYDSEDYPLIVGTLIYNNSRYVSTKTGSGNNLIFNRALSSSAVSTQQNVSFHWEFILTNESSEKSYFNSTFNNQTINPISAAFCGGAYTTPFLNISIFSQNDLSALNVVFKSTFNWGADSLTEILNYSDTSESKSTFDFCFDPTYETYILDGNIELEATGYTDMFYSLGQISITNTTTELNIYLLNTTASTSYIVHVRDSAYEDVSGAIVEVQRYYPSTNQWVTVESVETNIEGKAIAHLIEETVSYRFKVYVNTILVHTSTPTVIFCEATPCTITLTLPGEAGSFFDPFDELSNLEHSLTYTGNTFTFSYADTDTTALGGRLKVIKYALGGSTPVICDETSTDTTAVITCDISSEVNGTYIATGYINREGLTNRVVDRIVITKVSNIVTNIGVDGVLWGIFFIMGLVMLGLFKPAIAVVFGIAGFIMIAALGIASIPAVSLISVIIIALIVIWEFRQ